MTNFEIVRSIETEFDIKIVKFKSKATGLTAILVDRQAPLVDGFFALATEATNDDGCPHTLEHLVFLGSELYPYKGVLDTLATSALSDGTNAWTATDHTCYTIQTAGSQGFLNLLPIYVDHILYPTLTNSGCYTEVHHINGKGEDAGVVYSEMQGRENVGDALIDLKYRRLMYPEGCGYRSETGGLMENLRTLSVEAIRQYHKDYYRPDNLCLIVIGKISHDELLKVLGPLDERIAKKSPIQINKRPFVDSAPIPMLEKSVEEEVEFPDEDESMGQVVISWLGPLINEFLEIKALGILHEYLSDSAVSILQKEFVEIEDPLCTDVDISIDDQTRTAISAVFSNVPTEEVEELASHVFQVFNRIVESEGIDMDRMKIVLQLDKQRTLSEIETNPHQYFSEICIVDHLYGRQMGEDLERAAKNLKYYDQLSEFTEQQWIQYLKKYHLDNPHITILGKPSAEFAEKLVKQEEKRIEKQREKLGKEKSKELENRLEEAKKLNDVPVPPHVIEDFPIPSVDSIPFINVITGRNKSEEKYKNSVQEYLDHDSKINIPYFIQYDHINSVFVTISLYITTTNIPFELRPYINVYLEAFYSLPVTLPDGTKLTFDQVVSRLNEDTVDYDSSLGYNFEQLVVLRIRVEASKYIKGIQWLHYLLWRTEFTAERLKVVASKLMNEIPETKRDGYDMASTVAQLINFDEKLSNKYLISALYQEKFLPKIIKELDENKADQVIQRFYQFRELLVRPENFRIHVKGNILKLPNPKGVWAEHFKIIETTESLTPVPLSQQVLAESGRNPGNRSYIVRLPAIESTFSLHITKGPSSPDSPDLAPLLVLCGLLQIVEGLFWRLIRGQGLAYSIMLKVDIENGHIYFDIYKSPNAFKAYEEARKAVFDLADKKTEFDKSEFENAKSVVIYELVKNESNISKAATESFVVQVLKNMDAKYNRDLIAKVQAVRIEDLHLMLTRYLVNLFRPETSNVVVVSAPAKVKDVEQGFASHEFKIKIKNLDSFIE